MTLHTGQTVGTWSTVDSMPLARQWFGAGDGPVLLKDGRVLAVGGADVHGHSLADAALFDPTEGSWKPARAMAEDRRLHSVTRLDGGGVLVTGGFAGADAYPAQPLRTAEIFDPVLETWTATGPMNEARAGHTATLLPNGQVLVAGGRVPRSGDTASLSTAEIYDPGTQVWTTVKPMTDARWAHEAVLLADGRVLVTGGVCDVGRALAPSALCEVYDPRHDVWTPTGSLGAAHHGCGAVALPDGTVFLAGGGYVGMIEDWVFNSHCLWTAERYDPATGEWSRAEDMPAPRTAHRTVLLGTGEALVIGGGDGPGLLHGYHSTIRYDPLTHRWSPGGGLATGRMYFGAVVLADGRVLAAGGLEQEGYGTPDGVSVLTATAEVFTP